MGMNAISHVRCPSCGGVVGCGQTERMVHCSFCEASLLVDTDDFVPEYYVENRLEEIDVRRTLQSFLRGEAMPNGLLRGARFESARLWFVPYHEIRSRRLGTMEVPVESVQRFSRPMMAEEPKTFAGALEEERVVTLRRDTRVVTGDVHWIEPAVVREEYGLQETGLFQVLKSDRRRLRSFHRQSVATRGGIVPPSVDYRRTLSQMNIRGFSATVVDETEFVETRVKRIYYPIWRLQYRHAGRLYSATVDGVTGEVLYARAPQGERARVLWLLFGAGGTGLLLGRILSGITVGTGDVSGSGGWHSVFWAMALVIIALGTVWVWVWNQFRYPGDLIKAQGMLQVEKFSSLFGGRTRRPLFSIRDMIRRSGDSG